MGDQNHAADACFLDAQSKLNGPRKVCPFDRVREKDSSTDGACNDEVAVQICAQRLALDHSMLGFGPHGVVRWQ